VPNLASHTSRGGAGPRGAEGGERFRRDDLIADRDVAPERLVAAASAKTSERKILDREIRALAIRRNNPALELWIVGFV
jgi:hypothetical protein